jgi:hypothetical protein
MIVIGFFNQNKGNKMAPKEDKICGNCKYGELFGLLGNSEEDGICSRFPPVWMGEKKGCCFVEISDLSGCGEWKTKTIGKL